MFKRKKKLIVKYTKILRTNYISLLKPAEIDVNSFDGVKNWLAPMLLTVEPAGIIAVLIKWESVELEGRRWADGDSVSIEWRLSIFGDDDPSGQWTFCFLSEFVREDVGVRLLSDVLPASSLPDSV